MKLSDLKAGSFIQLDDGFPCRGPGPALIYHSDDGLYFECTRGRHYLSGQEDEEGNLIGISPIL